MTAEFMKETVCQAKSTAIGVGSSLLTRPRFGGDGIMLDDKKTLQRKCLITESDCAPYVARLYSRTNAPVVQLNGALPSEGGCQIRRWLMALEKGTDETKA